MRQDATPGAGDRQGAEAGRFTRIAAPRWDPAATPTRARFPEDAFTIAVPSRNSIGTGKTSDGARSLRPTRGPGNAERAVFAVSGDDRGSVWMHHGRPTRRGGKLSVAPRAVLRRRDVRRDDANRRGVGPGRSGRRSAVAPPAGREHPCPARGAFATRDSRRGTGVGGGARSARSTR